MNDKPILLVTAFCCIIIVLVVQGLSIIQIRSAFYDQLNLNNQILNMFNITSRRIDLLTEQYYQNDKLTTDELCDISNEILKDPLAKTSLKDIAKKFFSKYCRHETLRLT